jgi:hypothetical protein
MEDGVEMRGTLFNHRVEHLYAHVEIVNHLV